MKNTPVKSIVAIAIGAALFFVLGRFVAIPSPVPNTNISVQYGLLALLAACICDALAGRVARLLTASSTLGAELDSLADFEGYL